MRWNIGHTYSCLQHEYDPIRVACIKMLFQGDNGLERELLRAPLVSPRHQNEMLLHEERLSRSPAKTRS